MGSLPEQLHSYDIAARLESARTIPAAWYLDPAVHAAEQQAVFRNTWQFAGRASQVAQSGSYLSADIAGMPILEIGRAHV